MMPNGYIALILGLVAGCLNPLANVTAETLFEYKWPLEGRNSEHYFLQEQVRSQ